MYFKKLEIFGFKSFADKTILKFEPGITAIVGPNGCGKSNIFDAIRWVLGEQSVRELRGSSMEDVIFNGTDQKPALGFAEVSLTFSNESQMLPIEYSEVTITRRLYRSGESEYLLNKTPVRLKDITELLMGTGIGAEAYSLIQQGKVDLVVSARPEDRRVIFDEASGITKYKAKKREALNKLKDTENNLLRVNDIIVEVKRQISSIERQANKARRYKAEYEKLKFLELRLAQHQLGEYRNQQGGISSTINQLKEKETSLKDEIRDINALLESQGNLLEEVEQKINDVNSQDIKIEGQISINNKQIGFNEERIESLSSNTSRLAEKKEQLVQRCREQQNKIEELKQGLTDLFDSLQQKTKVLDENKENIRRVESSIAGAKREVKENEEKILETTSRQVNIKNSLTEIMKEIQGTLARKRRLDIENTKVVSEQQEINERLNNTTRQIETVTGEIGQIKMDYESKVSSFNEIKSKISALHQNINDLEKERVGLKSQKEFIEKMHVQYDGMPDPIVEGRLITSAPPLEQHDAIIGKVKQVLLLDGQKNQLFRQELNSVGDKELYEIVCEAKFIQSDPQSLISKIEEIGQEIQMKIEQKEDLIRQIEEKEKEIEQVTGQMHDKETNLSILESQKCDITEEHNKLLSELELIDSEITEAKDNLGTMKKKEEELIYYLDTLNQEIESYKAAIKEKQEFLAQRSQEREDLAVLIAQLETEIDSGAEKKRSQEENLEMFLKTLDVELEEIKKLDDEKIEYAQKKEQYVVEIESIKGKIEELRGQKRSLQGVLLEHQKQKDEIIQRLNSFRSNLEGIEEEVRTTEQEIHNQQMKDQELVFSEKGIKDRLSQTYKINIDEGIQEPEPEGLPQFEVASEKFITELERLKKRCDLFGSVNLVAIEEFEELKERYEFLTKQQSDLLEAKDSLHHTINKINRKTRQMFIETFTRVSEEFRIYFRMLFGGGEAQLVLLEPDNVLESGIEIVARPPGKKLQNISLLSGGEKTLTAIALVFGVFKVRPSPFCVLDEIDAALDETNVGRYGYLLKDFAKIAQFIVITHNKKTIEMANVMYGITMQERGVSKIVSVKFEEDEKKEGQQEVVAGAV